MSHRWIIRGLLIAAALVPSACVQILLGDHEYVSEETGSGGSAPSVSVGPSTIVPPVCDDGLTACGSACVSLDSDPANCGACGRDCLGADCHAGLCAPEEIATALLDPRGLAVDDAHVYWTTAAGAVQRADLDGGAITTLADDQVSPGPIAVDDKYVFWADLATGDVLRRKKNGTGNIKSLLKGDDLRGLSQDADGVYVARHSKKGEIRKVSKGGGGLPITLAVDQPDPTDVLVLGDQVVWSGQIFDEEGPPGEGEGKPGKEPPPEQLPPGDYVRAMPLKGGAVVTLAAGQGEIVALAAGAGRAIWADGVTLEILSRALDGGEPVTLVEQQAVRGLTADDAEIVWTTAGGTVRSMPVTGGAVRLLAADLTDAGRVVIGGQYAYFVRSGPGGAILRVAR